MLKRVGMLAMLLGGSLAVFAPTVAQAEDRDHHQRVERYRDERRDHDRFDHRRDYDRYDDCRRW